MLPPIYPVNQRMEAATFAAVAALRAVTPLLKHLPCISSIPYLKYRGYRRLNLGCRVLE